MPSWGVLFSIHWKSIDCILDRRPQLPTLCFHRTYFIALYMTGLCVRAYWRKHHFRSCHRIIQEKIKAQRGCWQWALKKRSRKWKLFLNSNLYPENSNLLIGRRDEKQKNSMVTLTFEFDSWKNQGRKVGKSCLRKEPPFYLYHIPSL